MLSWFTNMLWTLYVSTLKGTNHTLFQEEDCTSVMVICRVEASLDSVV